MTKKYTAKELDKMKTLFQGHTDDLKVEVKGKLRIWLSRMTKEDGMPYNNQITEERFFPKSGMWKTVRTYKG